MFCRECGRNLLQDSKFCDNCGIRVESAGQSKPMGATLLTPSPTGASEPTLEPKSGIFSTVGGKEWSAFSLAVIVSFVIQGFIYFNDITNPYRSLDNADYLINFTTWFLGNWLVFALIKRFTSK